jgi:beta-lactamase regulating signal transducer with metallopeptidase domain
MSELLLSLTPLSRALLGWLGEALILGTLLAGLTWLPAKLFRKKISPAFEVALWTIVLVRFLLPFGPGFAWSLPSLVETAYQNGPVAVTGLGQLAAELGTANPLAAETADAELAAITGGGIPWLPLIAISYLACVTALLLWRGRRHLALLNYCRALPPADARTRTLVGDVCRRFGVRKVPEVRVSGEFKSAFIVGLTRPLLVLSRCQTVRPNELETVVVHEVTHLRRGDPWLRCLQWIAGTVLFFWPVVAWVNRHIDLAREHACDRWALRHGKLCASEYARCLLEAVPSARLNGLAYRPTSMAGRTSTIERRIDMILESPLRPAGRPILRAATLVVLLVWSGFVLTGTAGTTECTLTSQMIDDHAKKIVQRISAYPSADVDGDGEIAFEERNAFLMAVFLQSPDTALDKISYSEPWQGRELDLEEVYDVVRGLSFRKKAMYEQKTAYVEAKEAGASQKKLDKLKTLLEQQELAGVETVLVAQDALLDSIIAEPEARVVAKIYGKIGAKREKESLLKLKEKAAIYAEKVIKLEELGEHEKADQLRKELQQLEQKIDKIESK